MASDLKKGRLKYIGVRYPQMKLTEDYKELLNNPQIDAVCVATSVSSHYDIAKAAILMG